MPKYIDLNDRRLNVLNRHNIYKRLFVITLSKPEDTRCVWICKLGSIHQSLFQSDYSVRDRGKNKQTKSMLSGPPKPAHTYCSVYFNRHNNVILIQRGFISKQRHFYLSVSRESETITISMIKKKMKSFSQILVCHQPTRK